MIIVTGASRGLGRAIAERLIARGHEVTGLARQSSDAPFPIIPCDVGDHGAVMAARRRLAATGTPVTGVVACAGVAAMNLALTTPASTVQRIVQTNLIGTIFTCQLLAPLVIRAGGGAIVTFSTIAVALGLNGESVYAASKAGVEAFTRVFAREMSAHRVRVNCIAPGPIPTDLTKGVPAESIAEIVSRQVIQAQFTPDAVSDLVELLLDPRAASLAGVILPVGGA